MPSNAVVSFRALHESGCFVMPNPWDVGSAVFLQHLGFRALASTSAGFGLSRALPDAVWAVPLAEVLAHLRELAAATPLPVNADFQSGFAKDAEGVAANVAACAATGVAGLSIEDATGEKTGNGLYTVPIALDRLRAARRAIDASGSGVLLTGRCESFLVGDADPMRTALDRLPRYAEAGADCLFAPGVRDLAQIRELVKAVAPKPLNVLASSPGLTVAALADAGVRRISVGSALSRVAYAAFVRAAKEIAGTGTFEAFADLAPSRELDPVFRARLERK